ncbi:MAG: RecX family transcriptional regulator [Rikenellaceae bacterium]|nr:RecX family transcriptional regulator [Rikenellaceae bacterium]
MEIKRCVGAERARNKLMARCARAEICISDAKRLLTNWNIAHEEQAEIIKILIEEKFIDEKRYAEAFVRDKINFSNWGRKKITDTLYTKRIPKEIISEVVVLIDEDTMSDKLKMALFRKNNSIKENDPYKRREKLFRFGVSRGYDYVDVKEAVEYIINKKPE